MPGGVLAPRRSAFAAVRGGRRLHEALMLVEGNSCDRDVCVINSGSFGASPWLATDEAKPCCRLLAEVREGLACREASVMPWRIGSPRKLPATAKVQLAADVVTVAKVQLAAEVATTAKVQLAAACRGGSARS